MYTVDELWNLHERSLSPSQRREPCHPHFLAGTMGRVEQHWAFEATICGSFQSDRPPAKPMATSTPALVRLLMFWARRADLRTELQRANSQNWQEKPTGAAACPGRILTNKRGAASTAPPEPHVHWASPSRGRRGREFACAIVRSSFGSSEKRAWGCLIHHQHHHHFVFCWRLFSFVFFFFSVYVSNRPPVMTLRHS